MASRNSIATKVIILASILGMAGSLTFERMGTTPLRHGSHSSSGAPQSAIRAAAASSAEAETASGSSSSGRGSSSSRLEEALSGLSEGERYNVVLQGTLRKAMQERGSSTSTLLEQECWPLLEEMGSRGKQLSTEGRALLVDAAVATDDAVAIEKSLRLARKAGGNGQGGLNRYSGEQGALQLLPSEDRRRAALLAELDPLPSDNRAAEVAIAGGLVASAATALAWAPLLGPLLGLPTDAFHNPGDEALFLAACGAGADLYAGDGALTDSALQGMSRLFTRDTARECRCEAASFLAAYLLGLPTFALAPTTLEALKVVDQSQQRQPPPPGMPAAAAAAAAASPLGADFGSEAGRLRLLVWLLAPVAAEAAEHAQLVVSDPRQATSLLKLLRSRDQKQPRSGGGGGDDDDASADELRLRWALRQAEELLRRNGALLDALRARMETGGATVGNCVALIERGV